MSCPFWGAWVLAATCICKAPARTGFTHPLNPPTHWASRAVDITSRWTESLTSRDGSGHRLVHPVAPGRFQWMMMDPGRPLLHLTNRCFIFSTVTDHGTNRTDPQQRINPPMADSFGENSVVHRSRSPVGPIWGQLVLPLFSMHIQMGVS